VRPEIWTLPEPLHLTSLPAGDMLDLTLGLSS